MGTYQHIKQEIGKMIDSKLWKVGQKLPSEYELAKYFGVSRETLRTAIKLLEQEGKLLVKHGVGTFVIKPLPMIPSRLEFLQSIGTMIKLAGLTEEENKEMIGEVECSPEWAEALNIEEGCGVVKLERIRYADGDAVAYSINIMPKELVGDAFERIDFSGSLFGFLEDKCKIQIARADTELLVPLKKDKYVQRLQIDKEEETPVILMKQLHYDEQNKEVLYSLDYLRNDVFNFWIRRERK
ncbi:MULTISPECIES: GntR family transcriptional regulator [Paenibacillus]|uniref:Transcriptional regulator n=1 Tax=Paenibacillus campinasensis TaxID=66347 RepID=A0A268ETR3_9BACL|nr:MULTISPECIES: GntR family transcriptional regulator [Paenibacillus]MUG67084.1 UTRA domain-containing protein [Paenibacillus campinasensis]PAD76491.1 transcriptional regulator [Paenibacillus campinasensis]PAK55027.1 transcriptional regulator [Paenibacillus sp. 7541]